MSPSNRLSGLRAKLFVEAPLPTEFASWRGPSGWADVHLEAGRACSSPSVCAEHTDAQAPSPARGPRGFWASPWGVPVLRTPPGLRAAANALQALLPPLLASSEPHR